MLTLAVVSLIFEDTNFYARRELDRAVVAVDTAIEAHPYRPQDFTASNPFVREILQTGIRIV